MARAPTYIGEAKLFEVAVESRGSELLAGRPEILFESDYHFLADGSRYFDFSPDGQRFLMFQSEIQASERDHEHIRVVLNWFDELEVTFEQFEQ